MNIFIDKSKIHNSINIYIYIYSYKKIIIVHKYKSNSKLNNNCYVYIIHTYIRVFIFIVNAIVITGNCVHTWGHTLHIWSDKCYYFDAIRISYFLKYICIIFTHLHEYTINFLLLKFCLYNSKQLFCLVEFWNSVRNFSQYFGHLFDTMILS